MRTSGASTETNLTLATVAVAVILVIYLFGGPSEFLLASEKLLRSVAEGIGGMVRAFSGWLVRPTVAGVGCHRPA